MNTKYFYSFIFFCSVMLLAGCEQEDSPIVTTVATDTAPIETMDAEKGGVEEDINFFPLGGVVPDGEVEAQNVVDREGVKEYRQLVRIKDGVDNYVSSFKQSAEIAGLVVTVVSTSQYRFLGDEHKVELRILSTQEGDKAHIVWSVSEPQASEALR